MTRLLKILMIPALVGILNAEAFAGHSIASIHSQIVKNRPKLNIKYVKSLRAAILKSCTKHKIPCNVYTAILMQESKYDLEAFNPDTKDHGISQINEKTAIAFRFNIAKLRTNLEYSVEAGAIVLADFMRMYGRKEKDYWTRYNSSRPSKRAVYKQLVTQYQ